MKAESSSAAGKPFWFEDRLKVVQLLLEHPELDKSERLKVQKDVGSLKDNDKLKALFFPTKSIFSFFSF